jgi:glycosyltransferase involved in cell wall biosynthesis
MDPRKNNRLLLAAFARFRAGGGREELVLIGRGYEPLQPLIASLGLQDAIHLTGYVDDRERSLLLAGATALVYPSLYEGFGLPVAEALQHGVRVITGRGGSLTEIGGAAAEYVDPITVDSLADAMRRVAGEPADERFRQNAREQVARFTSAQLDQELVATFVTLAGRCGGNVPVRA